MATKKNAAKKKAAPKKATGKIDNCKIRMYCLGTGDCFVLKFCSGLTEKFTMMIDCGSCQGTPAEFAPYIKDLAGYVKNHIDLLVITHEHNDHVNGFAKCEDVFKNSAFTIDEAWFAWTENPEDPGGLAKKLQEKRKKMRMALASAINEYKMQASNAYNSPISPDQLGDLRSASAEAEKEAIFNALITAKYNKSKAADLLNIDRKTLYNKIKQYNIEVDN